MLFIIIACALLVAACLYFVIHPFFAKGMAAAADVREKGLDMESVYEAVNELEMDALMGKISREDFDSMKETYYRLAAQTVQQKTTVDEEILAALHTIRAGDKEG
ncbi:hypothetical protein D1B31_11530 [Neobacillus notoginsengisoli]|uniref:Uncharacterized protein n=1 Tax=Neobacillus notoginsengisoli TaxID=1578198 RepID=A0A417YUM3_9BACI|nr:hypothetical protein [Neobacillus notoginsengisoli]RHW40812.1 hypothetical protein D1B31_11530 [Neobacillus notoginsengisoli]